MEHALSQLKAWRDYGHACRENSEEEFVSLWANFVRHQDPPSEGFYLEALKAFMDAYNEKES